MTDRPSELELLAYVDEQLDAGSRFAVETHLSEHPALAAHVMSELSARTALRLLAEKDAPVSRSWIEQARALHERRGWSIGRGVAAIGGFSLVAAMAAVFVIPARPPAYIDAALTSHRVAMLRANMASQIEAPALDAGEIQARTRIALPTLPGDWRITDAQLFPSGTGAALLVAVRTSEGRRLTLFALRERSDAPEVPDTVREGNQSVAYWRRGDMSYALTGDTDPETLDQVAEGINRSLS